MKYYRLNYRITAPRIRLVDDQGKYLGIFSIEEALKMAKDQELDLVEISPKENPPVVKIIDFGKFLYNQKKKDKDSKKKKQEVKVIRISLRVGKHDLETKKNQIFKFIEKQQKVRIEMILKGREKAHFDVAKKVMNDFMAMLGDKIKIEQPLTNIGGRISLLIS